MYHNGSNGVIDTDTTDSTMLIKAGGTQVMSLASTGHLTVGTNAGSRNMYLNSSGNSAFYLQQSGVSRAFFSISSNTAYIGYPSGGLIFSYGGNTKAWIGSSGQMRIYDKLYLSGSTDKYLYISGSDLYFYDGSSAINLTP